MDVGQTFRSLSGDRLSHLWVVVSKSANKDVVCFNVTTYKDDSDKACIIEAGEHDFIKHKSVIYYAEGHAYPEQTLDRVLKGDFVVGYVSDGLLKRIQQGALDSEETPQKLQALVQAYLNDS